MNLLLKIAVVVAVAAFGRISVLYLDSRAKYRKRLRRTLHAPLSR